MRFSVLQEATLHDCDSWREAQGIFSQGSGAQHGLKEIRREDQVSDSIVALYLLTWSSHEVLVCISQSPQAHLGSSGAKPGDDTFKWADLSGFLHVLQQFL